MGKTWREMVQEAKQQVRLVGVDEVKRKMEAGEPFILVDVREPDEYKRGHIKGVVPVPRGVLEMSVDRESRGFDPKFADPTAPIILHCAAGGRSALAALVMKQMGFTNVASMEGGFDGWARVGYPVER